MTLHPAPQFVPALRGYDRYQVDGYVATLTEQLAEGRDRVRAAEARADAAERRTAELQQQLAQEPQRPADLDVGERVGRILQLAAEEADHIRTSATSAAEEAVAGARARAGRILAAAEARAQEHDRERRRDQQAIQEEAGAALAEARRAAEAIVTEATAEADRVRAEAERELAAERTLLAGLRTHRDRVVAELEGLRETLDALVAAAPDEG
jgi:cell division septum initiation protein DivIVA